MTGSRMTSLATLVLLSICASPTIAGRLYGNASYSLEYVSVTDQRGSTEESLSRESAVINFEDALFTKNQLRLTANLQRREFSFSDYHEFRPIYIADLRSYGYTVNVRYSPYTRRSRLSGTDDLFDVRYRDWRVTGQLNYTDWPTVNVIYSRLKSFDDEVRRTDTYSRDWVVGASYTYDLVSLRANFSELKQIDNIARERATITRTYSGTAAINKSIAGVGYVSTTYNYYETRRSAQDITSQKSFTHSVSSLFSSNVIPMVSLSASYSGRFLESERDQFESSIATQNMSGMVGLSPVDYLNV